jgi:hypothetical protein
MAPLLLLALSAAPDAGVVSAPAPGPFSRNAVAKIVRQHQADLRACGTGGTITLTFVVSPEGRVRDVTTESMTITDASGLLSCVIHALRSWSFPSPGKRSATVREFPIVLPPK